VNEMRPACGEAASSAIQHAYSAGEGLLEIDIAMDGDAVEVTVRDRGTWRSPNGSEGGRGLRLIEGLMDSVEVSTGTDGTVVRMRRRLRARVRS